MNAVSIPSSGDSERTYWVPLAEEAAVLWRYGSIQLSSSLGGLLWCGIMFQKSEQKARPADQQSICGFWGPGPPGTSLCKWKLGTGFGQLNPALQERLKPVKLQTCFPLELKQNLTISTFISHYFPETWNTLVEKKKGGVEEKRGKKTSLHPLWNPVQRICCNGIPASNKTD